MGCVVKSLYGGKIENSRFLKLFFIHKWEVSITSLRFNRGKCYFKLEKK